MDSKKLRELEHQAERAYLSAKRSLQDTIDSEIAAAAHRIRHWYEDEQKHVGELCSAHYDAKRARQNAEIEEAKAGSFTLKSGIVLHPGDKVYRGARKMRNYSTKIVTERGIVEVVTHSTVFPDNISRWRCPDVGDVIVRLSKADGTPGKQVHKIFHTDEWQIEA